MLSAVEHALLKWKMQSSVVEHEASQVIYRCGFVLSWFDMKMPKSLNLVLAGNKKSTVARGYHKKVNDVCPSSSMTLNAHESWKVWILDFAFFCICVTGFYMHLFYQQSKCSFWRISYCLQYGKCYQSILSQMFFCTSR